MVVNHCVLTREQESGYGVPDAKTLEDFPMLVKVFESIVQAAECELCEGACPCNVAEIEVGIEAPNDFSRDETLNR